MPKPIPEIWRKTVLSILRRRTPVGKIEIVGKARKSWSRTFPSAFDGDLPEAAADWISKSDLEGRQVFGMTPPGTVYEFFAVYEKTKLYVKIGLHAENLVIIFSAHVPEKGDEL